MVVLTRPAAAAALLVALAAACTTPPRVAESAELRMLDCPNARDGLDAERSTPGILQRLAAETVARCIALGAL